MSGINTLEKLKTTIKDIKELIIPNVHEDRGKLAVVEKGIIPFEKINRIYYLYDIPSDAYRGGHAHLNQESLLIALSGSFNVVLDDGTDRRNVVLNKPNIGLFIPTGIWREIEDFSSGAVCLVLASTEYKEEDYIRDYKTFKLFKST